MNNKTRILCIALAAFFVLTLPFFLSSGALLDDERNRILDEMPSEGAGLLPE